MKGAVIVLKNSAGKRFLKWIWKVAPGKKHSHAREKARRVRQIERGILTEANGLEVDNG